MKRKVIQIAESTQLVSLPRKWCKENSIKKGDELEVEPQGNKIIVSASGEKEELKTTINMTGRKHFLRRPINVLYKLGYDEVQVNFTDSQILEPLQKEIEELLGFEIVNQTDHSCTIRNVASAMDKEFDNILRRIFLMLLEMSKDTYLACAKPDYAHLTEISKREKTNNRLTMFCMRLLNKEGYKEHGKQSSIYNFVCQLEYLADLYRDLCLYIINNKVKPRKEVLDILGKVNNLLDLTYKLFYKYDHDLLWQFRQEHLAVTNANFALLEKPRKDAPVLHYLLNLSELMRHMTEVAL